MLTLRDYQQKAIDSIYTYFATKQGNPLIVIPTGGGKSLVMAKFLHGVLSKYPEQRVLMLAHRKELLQQNKDELLDVWSEAPVGIYSAGLNKKEFDKPITIGGIQSYSRIQDKNLRFYDLVLIDECHLVPNESQGQYRKTIERLKEINPKMKIIGFTATPFRLQDGLLIEGDNRIFTDISYNVPISYLINHGYLTPFRSKITREIDLSKVKMQQGDYKISDLEKEYTELDLIRETVEKIIDYGQDRKSWIIFCVSVKHVEMVSEQLTERGVTCKYITGKTNSEERQNIIDQFKSRAIRAIVNCDVLTTGFNAKNIDMLIMLRPTKSTALYCLDNQTEILTSHGWKGIGEINPGDIVATLDFNSKQGKWSRVLAYCEREAYDDENMVEYSAPRANFRVTSNHNLIFETKSKSNKGFNGSYQIGKALKMALHKDSVRMPTAIQIDQPGIPLTDAELYFLGMVMTDGSISSQQISISQSERYPDVIERIERCLDECGLAYKKSRIKGYTQYNENYPRWRYLISQGKPKMNKPGSGARHLMPYLDKDFAPGLMSMSKSQFLILLQGINDGDGYKLKSPSIDWIPRSWIVCSARKIFMDRLQALAVINGFTAHLRAEKGKRKNPIYFITISPQDWRSVGGCGKRPQVAITTPRKKEKVWCVETETGTIVTRRKGKVTVMGNCQIIGRGCRLYPEKEDCLVLDFANNLQEHGEIEKIELKNLRGKPQLKKEKITIKPCPECEAPNHISRIYCIECDYKIREKVEREFTHKSDVTNVTIDGKLQNWLPVNNIIYKHHKSPEGNLSIKAIYDCKLQTIYKFLFPHKDNYARTLTQQWWNIHMEATLQYDLSNKKIDSLPRYIGEAEELKRSMPHNLGDFINHAIGFAKPTAINVEKEGKFYKIIDYRF